MQYHTISILNPEKEILICVLPIKREHPTSCAAFTAVFLKNGSKKRKKHPVGFYCSRWSTVGLLLSSDLCNCNRSTLSWIKHICLCYTSHCTGCLGLEHTSLKMWYLCEACCGLREEVSSTQRVCQRLKPHLQVSLAKISHKLFMLLVLLVVREL